MTKTMLDRYRDATTLSPERLLGLMKNRHVEPRWVGDGEQFWYRRDRESGGHEFVLVTAATGERQPLFDHERLAAQIGGFLGVEVAADTLPVVHYRAPDGGDAVVVLADGRTVSVSADGRITLVTRRAGVLPSPDGKQEIFRRDHDIWLRDTVTGEERALTTDGEPFYAWGALVDNSMIHIPLKRMGAPLPPFFSGFSPSGRYVVSARIDERTAREWPFVEHLPANGARPVVHPIRVVLDDEEYEDRSELAFIDVTSGERIVVELTQAMLSSFVMNGAEALTWAADEGHAYLFAHDSGATTAELLEIDVTSGTQRVAVTETDHPIYEPNTYLYSLPLIRVLPDTREAVWFSQRDGWSHLYLYDLATGECKNRITDGELVVTDLMRVDTARREIYFLAGCGSGGDNPYWRKLYRASLDGGPPVLLTPEPCDHDLPAPAPQFFAIIFGGGKPPAEPISPDGRYFVDHMSTVSESPRIVLRDASDGRVISTLEETDVTALLAAGFRTPEQFCVRSADDQADIWGIISLPADPIEPDAIPVIDLMYAGFQVAWQPAGYLGSGLRSKGAGPMSMYAALGFATVVLDGRGTSGRDKTFRQWTQGRPDTPRGLEDHVAAITALQAQYPQLDLDRVGVTGHSYGGYNSARSMLLFPDFFRVAVSSAGVHVPEKCSRGSWGWHVGADTAVGSDVYRALGNLHLADRLQGKLLIVFGDLDENATMDHSLALADALMKAGKRFDLKIWPGVNHYESNGYRTMVSWDYFVQHLLGEAPPDDFVPQTTTITGANIG